MSLTLKENHHIDVCFEELRISESQELEWNNQTILSLNESLNDPLKIYVDGELFAEGKLVSSHGKYAIKLLRILAPLTP